MTSFKRLSAGVRLILGGLLRPSLRFIALTLTALATLWAGHASVAQAAPPNSTPVWRLQARFVTANVDDSGTDDGVNIQLNGSNVTWLDSGRDDHERNSIETFDLRAEGINSLADIDFFRIAKTGSDGWALRTVEFLVNGVVIYRETFPGNLWLDDSGGHSRVFFMDDSFMRQRSEWLNYVVPSRPNPVPVGDLEHRIEALTGDSLHYFSGPQMNFVGGDDGVEMFAMTNNSWRVDLDMEDEKQWPFPDLDVDVDFDLTVSCVSGHLRFTTSNINVDDTWPAYDGHSGGFVHWRLPPRLDEMMKNFTFVTCPDIVLAANGDLHLNRRIPPFDFPNSFEFADTVAPIGLHVVTGGDINVGTKGPFVASAKSNLKQDSKVAVSFDLSSQIVAIDGVVQAESGGKTYAIKAEVKENGDGSSRLTFTDELLAGAITRYTLQLLYTSDKEEAGAIMTVIQPLDEPTAAEVTALTAETRFAFSKGVVVPQGTHIYSAQYVADLPKEQPAAK